MRKTVTLAVAFGLVFGLGMLAWAEGGQGQDKAAKGPGIMQQADANKDGKVTYEELKAVRPKLTEERFKELDTNGDGVLDKADHPKGKPGQHGGAVTALLKEADANNDGKVTYDEAKAVRPKMTEERFKALDKDGDGVLTKADVPKETTGTAAKSEAKDGGKKGGKLKAADVNNDGKVTFDELKAVSPGLTEEKFKELDKDGDGVITKADHQKKQ